MRAGSRQQRLEGGATQRCNTVSHTRGVRGALAIASARLPSAARVYLVVMETVLDGADHVPAELTAKTW
jgi:hypothetical protein